MTKPPAFFLLFLIFTESVLAADDEQRVKAELKEATVYLNAARLNITTQAQIPSGPSTVIIENLPDGISQESIQLSAKGDFVILGVQYTSNYLKEQKRTRQLEKLIDSLDVLNDRMEILNGRNTVLQKEEEMILKNQSLAGNDQGFKVEELAKLADFYRKRLTAIQEEKINLKQSRKELQKKLNTVNLQLQELRQDENSPSGEIRVSVSGKTAVTAKISCDFLVYNAGWQPLYDIRAKNTSSPIQLNFKAKVYQNTGMEWKNVKLTLSTSNPIISGNKPQLGIWHLDIFQQQLSDTYPEKKRKVLYDDIAMRSAAPQMAMEETEYSSAASTANYTTVQQTTLAAEYDIAIPYTIPSSGKQEVVEIQNYTVDAFYEYSCVPKLDNDAFLMAGLKGWEKLNLLPGTSNIYFENTYVGEAQIDPGNNTSDTLYVSLGRDKKIVVKRENVRDYTSKKTIGTNKKEEYGYEISLRNTKPEPVEITVEDQVPVSKTKEIEVELLEKSEARYESETGKLTWKVRLAPAETKKMRLNFSVKYPKNKQVTGL